MSFEFGVENVLTTLRSSLCPPSWRDDSGKFKGILFSLDLSLSHYVGDGEKQYRERNIVWVLFCGNTNVFYAEQRGNERWNEVPLERWVNTSNHDSCWRSDGLSFLSKMYFNWADSINAQMRADGYQEVPPIQMHQYCNLGFLVHEPYEFVSVDHEELKSDKYRYRRKLKSLDRISSSL